MPSSTHTVMVPLSGWGHAKPLCALACKLVMSSPSVVITLLTVPTLIDRCWTEISRGLHNVRNSPMDRIRVVSLAPPLDIDFIKLHGIFSANYVDAFLALCQGKAITCKLTEKTFDAVPAPTTVIVDLFSLDHLRTARKIAGSSIKIITYMACTEHWALRMHAPEKLGGLGDFGARIDAEALRTGRDVIEVGEEMYHFNDGRIVNIPGLPPMYDHEVFPHDLPFEIAQSPIIRNGYGSFQECDAVIANGCEEFQPLAVKALRSYLEDELSKPFYVVGPMLSPESSAVAEEDSKEEPFKQVEAFLSRAQAQHGAKSVVYITFGSLFWPSKPEYVEEIIGALIERDTPFIFTRGSPDATYPESLIKQINESQSGMVVPWAPQQYVLQHPATGWFLTHCGNGGVMESCSAGVPMICWPLTGDQPYTAAYITKSLNIAFELMQVRTGMGLKPILRENNLVPKGTREAVGVEFRHILDNLQSAEGLEKTSNVEAVKKLVIGTWEEGGLSRRALHEFISRYMTPV